MTHTTPSMASTPAAALPRRGQPVRAGRWAVAASSLGLSLALLGCANMSPSARATAVGATAGAVAGGVLTGTTTGAAVGAAVGGVIGNEVHKDGKK